MHQNCTGINSFLDKMAAILADDIFRYIFVNENFCILIEISLNFVPKGPIYMMAWRQIGNKALSKPMLTWLTDAYMQHQGEMS